MDWVRTQEGRHCLAHAGAALALTHEEWDQFVIFARSRSLAAGEVLFSEGECGDSMALVVDGLLSVRAHAGASDCEISQAHTGEFVGEMACFDPAPRSATVVARTPARVVTLDRTALDVMAAHVPRISSRVQGEVLSQLNARLERVDEAIDRIVAPHAPRTPVPPPSRPSSRPPARVSSRPPPAAPVAAEAPHEAHRPAPDAAPAVTAPRHETPSWWRSLVSRVVSPQ